MTTKKPERTQAEKDALRAIRRAKRLKREHTERTAQKHTRVRRYIVLAKRISDDQLFGFYDATKKEWSDKFVTLYDGNRWSRYRDNERPKRILSDVLRQCPDSIKESFHIFIVRAGSKKCPVKLDYGKNLQDHQKFIRNIKFTVKS